MHIHMQLIAEDVGVPLQFLLVCPDSSAAVDSSPSIQVISPHSDTFPAYDGQELWRSLYIELHSAPASLLIVPAVCFAPRGARRTLNASERAVKF